MCVYHPGFYAQQKRHPVACCLATRPPEQAARVGAQEVVELQKNRPPNPGRSWRILQKLSDLWCTIGKP